LTSGFRILDRCRHWIVYCHFCTSFYVLKCI
jgi:hypothetical protein